MTWINPLFWSIQMKQIIGLRGIHSFSCPSFSRLGCLIAPCGGLLLSLLMMHMITLVFPHQVEMMPLRLILGFGIVFNYIIPIGLTYTFFGRMGFWLSATVPFISYAVLYSMLNSILLGSIALLCEITYIVPLIIGGLGLAFIGCGSYLSRFDRALSRTCFACGILIFILRAPNVIPASFFVLSGDSTILQSIPNFF